MRQGCIFNKPAQFSRHPKRIFTALNGGQETLFFGYDGAVSSVGGVWSGMSCMPMPDGGDQVSRSR